MRWLANLLIASVAYADFSIVVLPDTQWASQNYPEVFLGQTEWIVNQDNVVFVLHEGDIVNRGNNPNHIYQWDNADAAISVLDGVVPYSLSVGNHDMGPNGNAENRDTTNYNLYFPYTRYESESWYGGHMGNDNDNHYTFLHAEGLDFIVISLEFGPNSEIIEWANSVLDQYFQHRAIILTHCYMNHDDTRVGTGDQYNPHDYGIDDIDDPHDGDEMWENLIRLHDNIFLVLSGHILGDGTGMLTSIGDHSNEVYQMLANYQLEENGGNGWLRILTFDAQEDTIYTKTYSPWLDEFKTDENNEFEIAYNMKVFGDWNDDGVIDLSDYAEFQNCLTGPDETIETECGIFDIDGDHDVDLVDMATFQSVFTE